MAARIGAVAFIHHCSASCNEHTQFHICVIDGVVAGTQDDSPVAFLEVTAMDAPTVAAIQSTIRRRTCSHVGRLFVRRGLLDADGLRTWVRGSTTAASPWMPQWTSEGVRIEGRNREVLERLLRYCARPPFALERIEHIDDARILYHLPKPTPNGQTRLTLTPLEFISRLAALIPTPRLHRLRIPACWRPMPGYARP